ncbi:hypothetical protein RAJCM14343_1323 [Rhodococcus aetherivorans]|uniref:Uncharacterized protein n=1 Tax=Rhodococcus aetherivorans TaxID=191292 RepID=A0ABQ0YHV9_9NOCA|nr:hypothetical protein RAJCM14343_1323 [Rhodococcus aetherivorans]
MSGKPDQRPTSPVLFCRSSNLRMFTVAAVGVFARCHS